MLSDLARDFSPEDRIWSERMFSLSQAGSVDILFHHREIMYEISGPVVKESRLFPEGTEITLFSSLPLVNLQSAEVISEHTGNNVLRVRVAAAPVYRVSDYPEYLLETLGGWLSVKGDLIKVVEFFRGLTCIAEEEELLRHLCPSRIRVSQYDLFKSRDKARVEKESNKFVGLFGSRGSSALELLDPRLDVEKMRLYDFLISCSSAASRAIPLKVSDRWCRGRCGGTPIAVREQIPGTEASWALNPQFLLEVLEFKGEVEVDVILSAARPTEMFICMLSACSDVTRVSKFDKERIVKSGGASRLIQGRIASFTATVGSPGKFVIVPSTWEIDLEIDFAVHAVVTGNAGLMEARLSSIG